MTASEPPVVIVGAGLAGSLLAIYLARRGQRVEVYEKRPDPRQVLGAGGRSINLGLSKRGIQALGEVGLLDEVLARAVVMKGRVIHALDGAVSFQPYGKDPHEVLHSIDRHELNRALIEKAESFPGVGFHFGATCVGLDKSAGSVSFRHSESRELQRVEAQVVVGADGAFSRVRQEMHYAERADYQQEFLEWGYKELTLPARADGRSAVELNALHVWPRGHCLIVTHPNLNGSHTCTLFLPFEGHDSFASIATGDDVLALFQKYFPDLVPIMPGLVEEWMSHPTGTLITTRTAPWHHRGRVVLVGDACHAVYPFYGQGMNAAFEDCSVLDRCIGAHPGDFEAAFAAYQAARKPHTDTLAELSKENFVELRQRVRSPLFMARKKADIVLNRLFPRAWLPLYTMISHTTMPYGDALARARTQDRLLGWLALGAGIVLMLLAGAR